MPVLAATCAAPAWAGEAVRFEQEPEWVVPADFAQAAAQKEEIVLFDRQLRLEQGVVQRFTDVAYDIRNADVLSKLATLQFGWLPDKGDLIIHRLEIIRDGAVIDLVKEGVRPDVIRRETELERRTVNGALTALFKLPGLKVGDILRFTSSTTTRDQALAGAMQATEALTPRPTRLGFGRLRMSWPLDSGVHHALIGQAPQPSVTDRGGYRTIEVILPIEKLDEMPEDAPDRYKVRPSVIAGTFAAWSDVASVMAPHYQTVGSVPAGSALAAEIERIRAASADPRERAALALRSVQDEVNYLMNGMDGGNYLPQSPVETWTLRYGDCKAKTLLLLAMLRELDIESEAVLVNASTGDAVSLWQPAPGAFDHVLVKARIEDTDFWLDGTGAGTRLATMGEVPNFTYALPIRASGAELIKLEQRWPTVADRTYRISYDMSRGVDIPALYQIEVEMRGTLAARMAPQATETDRKITLANAQKFLDDVFESVVYDAGYTYDAETGTARLAARGILLDPFGVERDLATHTIYTASTNWSFEPDRARTAWRDIPYRVGGPMTSAAEVVFKLPDGGKGAAITGTGTIADQIVAGTRFERTLVFEGDSVIVKDRSSYVPAEIAPADLAAAKAAMRSLSSADPAIRITSPRRYWELDDSEIAQRMKGLIEPVGRLIGLLPDEAAYYQFRGALNALGRDYKAALVDIDRAIALDGDADAYVARAGILTQAGRFAEAAEAARSAYELKGDLATAAALANALALSGKADEGLAVLDAIDVSGDEMSQVAQVFAEVAGATDRADEAWGRLEAALAERPGDELLLNSQCWFIGTWNYRAEEAQQLCDKAVRAGNYSAMALDSRALAFHRLGREDEALEDLEAALKKNPAQAASLYLRGIIKLDRGDVAGKEDLLHALRLSPDIAARYQRYGIAAPGG